MEFDDLREQLDTLAGLDLSTTDRDLLINEGYRELAVRSEFLQRTADLGPTVSGTNSYSVPANMHRIMFLSLGTTPYVRAKNRQYTEEIAAGTRALRAPGVYWIHRDGLGAEYVNLYPAPTSSGTSINARIVFIPGDLSSGTDVPIVPTFSHRAIVDYAAAQAYALAEDNTDLANQFMADFERRLGQVKELVRGRASDPDYLVQEEIAAAGG